jgi:lipopolysaccharide biosynthesis glycosyltransferase
MRLHPHIVLAADERFAMPLATTLRSIVESQPAGRPMRFSVLTDHFGEREKARVRASLPDGSAEIEWLQISLDMFADLKTAPGVSSMTFARLLLHRVLPSDVSRVIYLDCDLLIRGDLLPLWKMDLKGCTVGAVRDAMDEPVKRGLRQVPGMPCVSRYFNAGVLLIDLDRWRRHDVSTQVLTYQNRNPRSPYMDQDGLNVVLDGQWFELDSRWNFQNHYTTAIAAMPASEQPTIVHFVTSLKPWLATSLSPNADLYEDVRSRTLFARSYGEKSRDAIVSQWYRTKRFARQSSVIRDLETRFRPTVRGRIYEEVPR